MWLFHFADMVRKDATGEKACESSSGRWWRRQKGEERKEGREEKEEIKEKQILIIHEKQQ